MAGIRTSHVPYKGAAGELSRYKRSELIKWARVIKDSNIRMD
jgi:hypothetical protein